MKPANPARVCWILITVAVLAGLLWLDTTRGGPASDLSRCNLALTRSTEPAADVLVVGSSRTGVALDPVAMQGMLAAAGLENLRVERIALGRNPLRANVALVENYLANRGAPKLIAFELSFLTERTVDNIASLGTGVSADAFLYRRDLNLIDYSQIASSPAVARPYSEDENALNRVRFALQGLVNRTGALVYQFASDPTADFTTAECSKEDWTREPEWPDDFAFSWDDAEAIAPPAERIDALRAEIAKEATGRTLQSWQQDTTVGAHYPFEFDEPHRVGELRLLEQAIDQAAAMDVPVLLLPMTLYGATTDPEDMRWLEERFAGDAAIFDVYGAAGVDLSTYWYDDAHLEIGAAAELTTALLAQYILEGGALTGEPAGRSEP